MAPTGIAATSRSCYRGTTSVCSSSGLSGSSLDAEAVSAKDILRVVFRLDLEESIAVAEVVGRGPRVEVGVGEVREHAARAVPMREGPRACEPRAGVVAVAARGSRVEDDGMLEEVALLPVDERRRVRFHGVVGASPRSEVQLACLAVSSVGCEVVDQRLHGVAGERRAEELGLVEDHVGRERLVGCRFQLFEPWGAFDQELSGGRTGKLLERARGGIGARSDGELVDQNGGLAPRPQSGAEKRDNGLSVDIAESVQ